MVMINCTNTIIIQHCFQFLLREEYRWFFVSANRPALYDYHILPYKHLQKNNAACFYTPIVLKLLFIVQM